MTKHTAPDLATMDQWSKETGIPIHTGYRLMHRGALPHVKVGERGYKVLMPAYRKMVQGEPIAADLLEGRIVTTRTDAEVA